MIKIDPGLNPEQYAIANEFFQKASRYASSLPEKRRHLIQKICFEGFTPTEYANEFGGNPAAIRQAVKRFRDDLKLSLGNPFGRRTDLSARKREAMDKQRMRKVRLFDAGTNLLGIYTSARGVPTVAVEDSRGIKWQVIGANAVERMLNLLALWGMGGMTIAFLGAKGIFKKATIKEENEIMYEEEGLITVNGQRFLVQHNEDGSVVLGCPVTKYKLATLTSDLFENHTDEQLEVFFRFVAIKGVILRLGLDWPTFLQRLEERTSGHASSQGSCDD